MSRQQAGEIPARTNAAEVAVYRFFDRDGGLLYIGVADEPLRRWYSHTHRNWWASVVRYEVTWCESRSEALRTERVAIAVDKPRYNVQYNREREPNLLKTSPVLTRIMLDDFWGRTFTVLQVANETGFSTTSAAKTIRALVETGLAVRVSLRPVTPTYTLIEPDAEPPAE